MPTMLFRHIIITGITTRIITIIIIIIIDTGGIVTGITGSDGSDGVR